MSYKERIVTTKGYSRLGTEADDGMNMFRDIEEQKTIKGDEPKVLIPFHAVDRVVKTTAMEDRADKNPYGCTAEGSGGDAKVDSAKTCTDNVGCGA